jgi:serine/threonine protein kinase
VLEGETAEALDFLHAQQVIHRDIKPTNLLRLQGHAKVGDFGLARLFPRGKETATFCGTPRYMAPEVWTGAVSVHTDQYSLAATCIEMCVGQRLPPAGQRDGGSLLPSGGLSEAEQRLLRKALAQGPDQRFPSCLDFVRALREAATPPPPRRRRYSAFWAWVVPLGLIAVLVGLTVRAIVKPPSESPTRRPDWLPQGFKVKEDGEGPRLPRSIVFVGLPGVEPIEFLLIPQQKSGGPPDFYIMKHKVTNGQFRAALGQPRMQALLAEWAVKCPSMPKVACLDQTKDAVWFLAESSSRQPSVATTFRYAASTEVHSHSPVPSFPHPVHLDGSGSPWALPVCSRTPRYRGACAGREPTWTLIGAVVTRH